MSSIDCVYYDDVSLEIDFSSVLPDTLVCGICVDLV